MEIRSLTRQQVRDVDRRAIQVYGMSGLVLMENAGRGCADQLCSLGVRGPVVVCCGSGNNGGDGFVIARHLLVRGLTPRVLIFSNPEKLQGDAAANFQILIRCGLDVQRAAAWDAIAIDQSLQDADWIVDALLGTGARGDPKAPLDRLIPRLNRAAARRLAVDLPSGLDCDTGEPAGDTFRADHTCTFVAPKAGFAAPTAGAYLGRVHVLDIGVPWRVVQEVLTPGGGICGAPGRDPPDENPTF